MSVVIVKTSKVKPVTLYWMNKIRKWTNKGYSSNEILAKLFMYGLTEETRITKAFEKSMKEWRKKNDKDIDR